MSSLLSRLHDAGARVTAQGDHLLIDAPGGIVTEEYRQILVERKPEVLSLLRSQERILGMSLGQFEQAGCCLEVRVPGLSETLWFVPREEHAERLQLESVSRGLIWTATELRDLMSAPGMTHDDVLSVARAKIAFDATEVDVRPAGRPAPDAAEQPVQPEPVQGSLSFEVPISEEHNR